MKQNSEKRRAKQKAFYVQNRKKIRAEQKAYYVQNREKLLTKQKAFYVQNREKVLAYTKAYRIQNPEKCRAAKKSSQAKDPKKYRAMDNFYYNSRYAEDPGFRVLVNYRNRIRSALRGSGKSARTEGLIGCTISEVRARLESQFRPGMTWKNYGSVWHIDHIRPCASFDLTDPAQQRECFHFSNLQPLFAEENLKKSNKEFDKPAAVCETAP